LEIPKSIQKLIDQRIKYALKYNEISNDLFDWINKNEIEVEMMDYIDGIEPIVHPYQSASRIQEAIKNK